jgi:hypothetical protein
MRNFLERDRRRDAVYELGAEGLQNLVGRRPATYRVARSARSAVGYLHPPLARVPRCGLRQLPECGGSKPQALRTIANLDGARTTICVVQFLQSSVQVLGEESVHQESLGEIPGTNKVKRMLVVSILHHARIADHLPDPNGD